MNRSLLEEIERDAADDAVPLGNLLRRCQILATRLDNPQLRDWVDHELDGYPKDGEVPSYRAGIPTFLCGDFRNSAWQVSHQVLPVEGLPSEVREDLETVDLYQGVAELDHIERSSEGGAVRLYLSPSVWSVLARGIGVQNMAPTNMWREFSASRIESVLDQVRNRALKFVLELERLDPSAGSSSAVAPGVSPSIVTQVFNAVIMGQNVQYAPASTNASQEVVPGDLASLKRQLIALGVDEEALSALEEAFAADGRQRGEVPGPNVSGWIGRLTVRLTAAAGGIAGSATAGLIATAIAKYLGIA